MIVRLPLPCFVCGRELTPVFSGGGHDRRQPNDAVMCSTPGNYGSTVFDSISGIRLEFNVCDNCLTERATRVRQVRYITRRVEEFYETWDPTTSTD